MFGALNNEEIKSILSNNILGRIGFHDGTQTYIFPISYAYHNQTIYCHSEEGSKLDILRENPSVCFQVDEVIDMANWKSVIGWGQYTEISDAKERSEALHYLADRTLPLVSSETTHLFPHWPFPPEDYNEIKGVVFKIIIEKSTGRFERFERNPLIRR